MENKKGKLNKGVSIIEILVVVTFVVVSFTSLLGLIAYSLRTSNLIKKTVQAGSLTQEAMEAVRNFRDGTDWNVNGLKDYVGIDATSSGPWQVKLDTTFSPPKWALAAGTETIDNFSRQVFFEKVSRDFNKNIQDVYSSVGDDPNTRKVTAKVFWEGKEVKLSTYLTNWK